MRLFRHCFLTLAACLVFLPFDALANNASGNSSVTNKAQVKNKSLISKQAQQTADFAVDQYTLAAKNALAEMIAFKTVAREDIAYQDNPEFTGFRQWLVKKARVLGLNVSDQGHVLLVSVGSGKKALGLITHGDVQPANPSKWQQSPFTLDDQSEPGKWLGRGTEDDKGPIAAALYAMKALKEKQIPLTGKIELIIYMAEESDWEPLQAFLKTYDPAPINIALDSEYPVVIAEKAWGHIVTRFPQANPATESHKPFIHHFKGGAFRSQIPEDAIVEVSGLSNAQLAGIRSRLDASKLTYTITQLAATTANAQTTQLISVKGKAAHSSKPEYGVNAISHLANALARIPWKPSSAANAVRFLNDQVGIGIHARKFGDIAYAHDFMGPMTLSPTMVYQNDDQITELFINLRRPLGKSSDTLKQQISDAYQQWQQNSHLKAEIKEIYIGEPLMVQNAPHVPTLLNVFDHFTDISNPKPIAIGGSTNAKLFPNAVSFGPSMPNTEYTGHSEHEFITEQQFRLTLAMYTAMMVDIAGNK